MLVIKKQDIKTARVKHHATINKQTEDETILVSEPVSSQLKVRDYI